MKLFLCSAMLSLAHGAEDDRKWWAKKAVIQQAPFSTYSHVKKSDPGSRVLTDTKLGDLLFKEEKSKPSFERIRPDFASPTNKGRERQELEPAVRTGDELILKSERRATAAIRDKELAGAYKTRPFHMNKTDNEPVYPEGSKKAFLSPVFLVDPIFTEFKKDEDIIVFRDNDFGGWE